MTREEVLFVGLGRMGERIAGRLLEAGFSVHVYDQDKSKMAALVERGGVGLAIEDMACLTYQRAILCLPTPGAVEGVLGPWLAAGLPNGAVVIDLTTMAPSTARERAEKCQAAGGFYLDTPVSGGERGAETGDMVVLTSGEQQAYEATLLLLRQVGREVHYLGASGAASLLKAINQFVYLCYNFAFARGLALGRELGLPEQALMGTLTKGAPANTLINDRLPIVKESAYREGFTIERCLKDLDCLELPESFDPHVLDLYDMLRTELRNAVDRGLGDFDILVLGESRRAGDSKKV